MMDHQTPDEGDVFEGHRWSAKLIQEEENDWSDATRVKTLRSCSWLTTHPYCSLMLQLASRAKDTRRHEDQLSFLSDSSSMELRPRKKTTEICTQIFWEAVELLLRVANQIQTNISDAFCEVARHSHGQP